MTTLPDDLFTLVSAAIQSIAALIALLLAWRALRVAREQLVPIRREVEKIAVEQQRQDAFAQELVPPRQPRQIVGFDPRFTNREWTRFLLANSSSLTNLNARMSRTYSECYRTMLSDLRSGHLRNSIVVVDLLFVPKLLHHGLIAPLTANSNIDLDAMLERRATLLGIKLEQPAIDMIRLMCSDTEGTVGALPLWINTHGRMIPDAVPFGSEGRVTQVASFDGLLDRRDAEKLLCEAGVQSSYLIFEFWAHLAYRSCRLLESAAPRKLTSSINAPSQRRLLAEAVSDLAVRLCFCRLTSDTFARAQTVEQLKKQDEFQVEHAGDARIVREGLCLWKPVFSSELLWRTLPQRGAPPDMSLADETSFHPPFVRYEGKDSWRYLSALGGYGLALPASAATDVDSIRALKDVFLCNPLMMHPYVNDMLPNEIDTTTVDDFVGRYARPRWPFWPEVEDAVVDMMFSLFLTLPRSEVGTPRDAWGRWVETITRSQSADQCVLSFCKRIHAIADEAGWEFSEDSRRS